MLHKVSAYFTKSKKHLFDQLSRTKFRPSAKGLCCIGISPQELTIVSTQEIAGKLTIELCESHPYKNLNHLLSILTLLVKDNHLKNMPCSLMLQPDDYQLLVTDALPVTPAEFQAAIRWKVKDLIHFPPNDSVIDSFAIPKMKTNQNKLMVIAAQLSKLKMISDQIRSCHLDIKYIDIPELGLRNITILFEQDDQATMLIYVQENSIQLLITSRQEIYVARLLKFSLNMEDVNTISQSIEHLASEIHRSLDYYSSLWTPLSSRYIFASTKAISADAIELLSQKIKSPIERVNMMNALACKPKLDFEQQGKYLPVIGGALRESIKHATTG